MKVLKFGGTSVGKPERMHAVAALIQPDGEKIVVLSALSGTTNVLVEISNACYQKNRTLALQLTEKLYASYLPFVEKLFTTAAGKAKGKEIVDAYFAEITKLATGEFSQREEKIMLAQGELISTNLFQAYLETCGVDSVLLPALNFMRTDENGEPALLYIEEHIRKELAAHPGKKIFITQGYICRNAYGEVDNLKRGGSDYTGTLLGAAVRAEEIQIWTDIDGMHNNDPRIVKHTKPVAVLSFDEAAELAYFGAKILHPTCVWPAQKYHIPVRLLNTMSPESKGTLITDTANDSSIKAVAAKDGITAIKIKSSRMLMAYGFLRSVFEVFERYKTPIDMITTSEVAVSLTIDNPTHLEEIVSELGKFGTVEVDAKQTIVCVVGDFLADKPGYGDKILGALKDIPIRMISYGGSTNNVSLLVNTPFKEKALNALHQGLFLQDNAMA